MVTRPAGARGSYHRGREERLAEGIQSRLLEHASRDPRAPFLLAPGRAPMSYGLMAEHVEHLGERFGAWGIARGDIVVMPAFDRAIACMMLAAAPCASAIALLPTSLGVDGCGELLDRMHPRAVLVPGVETPLGAAAAARGIARIEVASAGDAASHGEPWSPRDAREGTPLESADTQRDEGAGMETAEAGAAEPRGEGSRRRGRGRGRDRERAPREGEQVGSEAPVAEHGDRADPMFVPFDSGLDGGDAPERTPRGEEPMTAADSSSRSTPALARSLTRLLSEPICSPRQRAE